MKNVLIISYMFPPIAGAGIQRILKFLKFLPDYNIRPVVFCPENAIWNAMDPNNLSLPYLNEIKIYRCGIRKLRQYYFLRYTRMFKRHPYFLFLALKYIWSLDYFSSWYFECRETAIKIAAKEKIDCVLTSSPPHSVQLFGAYLKEKTNLPWIMDLRDAMFDNPDRDFKRISIKMQAKIEKYYEKKFLKKADAIISVSQPILESISKRYLPLNCISKSHLITNGFDQEDYQKFNVETQNTGKLIITYTGSFLGKRTPIHFLEAMSMLYKKSLIDINSILIRFIGSFDDAVLKKIRDYKNFCNIEILGFQPYDKALYYQMSSDILLLINSVSEDQGGSQVLTGKIFEYIGAMKPIFALTPDGPLKNIIQKGNFGSVAPPRDVKRIAYEFKKVYEKWHKEKRLAFEPDVEFRNTFSRKKQAEKLSSIINCLTQS
ncbi:glycosyl transferase family 1 [Desulfosarcina widdelii]|uniref:Glycosyl transferase family 1 n=1 Tax=Desulfosarcina widdelii TaxID=947919 RepID=A0A5K7YU31_9BACT|nr:glycosyltransferase [Desulfosarcina widdelii]BBO73282.1 glycosyl transferase family 1 [Desulfosarcina widdelii]